MSSTMRYRRLQILAAAVGVGIGVMTGQGIATADPDDTSGSTDTSTSTSETEDTGTQSSSSQSSSSSTSTTADEDTPAPPVVRGNGLSNPFTDNLRNQNPLPGLVGGNGLSNHHTTPEPSNTDTSAPQVTTQSERRDRSNRTTAPTIETSNPTTTNTVVEHITQSLPEHTAKLDVPEISAVTTTFTQASLAAPASPLQQTAVPQTTLSDRTNDFTPLITALATPSLPPLGPGPTPPLAPLTVALAAYAARRTNESNRVQAETPAAQLATNSLGLTNPFTSGSTGIPGVDNFFTQQSASFNQKFHNQTPTATPTTPVQNANGTITGSIGGHDADGDRLTYTVTEQPEHGTVVVNSDGTYTYTPDADTATNGGTDSFTVTVSDNTNSHSHGNFDWLTGTSAHTTTATVDLDITAANQPPGAVTAVVDSTDPETGVITGHFTATDPNGDDVDYTVATPPTRGTLDVDTETGAFTYTPDPQERYAAGATGADATDEFQITATDTHGAATTTDLAATISPTQATTITTAGNDGVTTQVTPDGKHTVVYTSKQTGDTTTSYVTIIDNTTGAKTTVESPGTGNVKLSEDGKTAVLTTTQPTGTTTSSTRATVIDVATGDIVGTVDRDGYGDTVLTEDGSRAILRTTVFDAGTNTYDTEVTVIDTATGQALGPTMSTAGYGDIDVTPDGTRVVLTTNDNGNAQVTVVDTATGTVVGATVDKTGSLGVVHAVSPDGKYVILATNQVDSFDNVTTDITVISTETGTVVDERTEEGEDQAITFAPDGKHAVVTTTVLHSSGYTSTATIVDTETGLVGASFTQTGYQPRLSFTPDGSRVILRTANFDGQNTNNYIQVIDLENGTSKGSAQQVGENSLVTVSPDGSYAIVTTDDYISGHQIVRVTVLDTETGATTGSFTRLGTAYHVNFTDDSHAIITTRLGATEATYTTNVSFVDAAAGTATTPINVGGTVVDIQVTPDGSRGLITRKVSGGPVLMTIVDTQTGTVVTTVTQSGDFRDVELTADGKHAVLVTTTFDTSYSSEITVVDTETGVTTAHVTPEGNGQDAVVSPDGKHILVESLAYDSTALKYTDHITIIDAETGRQVGGDIAQEGASSTITFSPDGSHAVVTTATHNYTGTGNITIIDLETGETQRLSQPGMPETVTFSEDGNHVVVSSRVIDAGTNTTRLVMVDLTTKEVYTAPDTLGGQVTDLKVVESGGDEYVVATVTKSDGTTDTALYRNPTESWDANVAPSAVTIVVDGVDPVTGTVTGHFTSTDDQTVTYTVTTPPTRGTLTVDESGNFTYTPSDEARYAAGASGTSTVDTFEVTATDSLGGATTTELGVVISPADEYSITDTSNYAGAIYHSPDRKHTLLVSSGSGVTHVTVVDIATGEASETHTQQGTLSTSSITFTASGDRVWVVTADNANDKTYVSAIDVETGAATPTQELAGLYRASKMTADGEQVYVVVGDFLGYAPDGINTMWNSRVYIVDGDTGTATLVQSVAGTVRLALGDSDHTYVSTIANDRSKTTVTTIVNDTGQTYGTLIEQNGEGFLSVAPDGKHAVLVTSSGHTYISVIDAEGNRVGTEFTQAGFGGTVQFTPDGKHAYLVTLTGSWDAHLVLIDTETGAHTTIDQAGQGHPYISPDGTKLALVTMDGNNTYTRIIDIETGTALGTLTTQTGSEYSGITFTNDGKYVYVGASAGLFATSRESSVAIVDTETGIGVTTADIPGRINKIVVMPDGESAYVTVTYDDGTAISTSVIRVSVDGTQQIIATVPEDSNQVQNYLLISSDGSHVVASTNNSVIVVDTATQNHTTTTFTDSVSTVVMSPDGTQVVVLTTDSSSNTHVTLIDTATGTATTGVIQTGTRRQVEYSPDSARVYVTTQSGSTFTVAVYDTQTGAQLDAATFPGPGIFSRTDVVEIDGNEYLVVEFRPNTGGAQLTLLRNFGSDDVV